MNPIRTNDHFITIVAVRSSIFVYGRFFLLIEVIEVVAGTRGDSLGKNYLQ